jgi:hypothetical protein
MELVWISGPKQRLTKSTKCGHDTMPKSRSIWVPFSSGAVEVQGRHPHLLILWNTVSTEETIALVEPSQRIRLAVEGGKGDFGRPVLLSVVIDESTSTTVVVVATSSIATVATTSVAEVAVIASTARVVAASAPIVAVSVVVVVAIL